jgi:hypothetical protein
LGEINDEKRKGGKGKSVKAGSVKLCLTKSVMLPQRRQRRTKRRSGQQCLVILPVLQATARYVVVSIQGSADNGLRITRAITPNLRALFGRCVGRDRLYAATNDERRKLAGPGERIAVEMGNPSQMCDRLSGTNFTIHLIFLPLPPTRRNTLWG